MKIIFIFLHSLLLQNGIVKKIMRYFFLLLCISVTTIKVWAQCGTIVPTLTGPSNICLSDGLLNTYTTYTTESGMSNYNWIVSSDGYIGSGGDQNSNTVTVFWNSLGSKDIKVQYVSNGCQSLQSAISLTVIPRDTPTITSSVNTICAGELVTFTTEPGMSNYNWLLPNSTFAIAGGTSSDNTLTRTWGSGPASQGVTYTGLNGCTSFTASKPIQVNPLPIPLVAGNSVVCSGVGGNVYTTDAGMSNYIWNASGGAITSDGTLSSNTATITWNATGNRTLSVLYTDSNGCAATGGFPLFITVKPTPVPSISYTTACLTPGNVYTTEAGMSNYAWTVSGGGTITAGGTPTDNTVTVTWNSTGAQSVSVAYTGSNGCLSPTTIKSFNITNPPVPVITGSTAACPHQGNAWIVGDYNYKADVKGVSNFTWTLTNGWNGSGTTQTNTLPVSWYGGPGTVSLNYTDINGCRALTPTTLNVDVSNYPIVTGNFYPCIHTPYTYTADPGMTSYTWSAPALDGTTISASDNSAVISYANQNSTGFTLVTTNSRGCTMSSHYTVRITILQQTITFNDIPNQILGASPFNLTASASSGLPVTYTSSDPSVANITGNTVTVLKAGAVTITASQAGTGCYYAAPSISKTLIICPTTLPIITSDGPTTFCSANLNLIVLKASTESSYLWSTGATTQSISVSTSGSYTVTTTNSNGCSTTSAPTVVTVNSSPTATISASGSTSICSGASVTLTASSGSSYHWSTGATTQSISVNSAGSYSVTVTNSSGCSTTSNSTGVTVNPTPNPPSITGTSTICSGSSVVLTGNTNSTGSYSYSWSNGQTGSSITVSAAGSYSVTARNTSTGCSATSSSFNTSVASSAGTITAPNGLQICPSGPITLTAGSGSAYSWSNGFTNATINVNTPGTYTVNYTSSSGCHVSASRTVTRGPANCAYSFSFVNFPELTDDNGYESDNSKDNPIINVPSLYPNPVDKKLNFVTPENVTFDIQLTIYDQVGKHQLTGTLFKGEKETTLYVGDLTNGLYILKTSSGLSQKFIVLHE